MFRVNLIGGVPATGKTTIMKQIKKQLQVDSFFEKGILKGYTDKKKNNYIFGVYNNELFEGTDKLSMAVQPKAIEFIKEKKFQSIFIEGDRLFKPSFINQIKKIVDLNIYILQVDSQNIENRHIVRGDEQSENWLRAKKTTVDNIKNNHPVHLLINNNKTHIIENIEYIIRNNKSKIKNPLQKSLF